MKQKHLPILSLAVSMAFTVSAWSQDSDNFSDNITPVIYTQQQGTVYASPFDSYFFNWYPVSDFPATSNTFYHHASAIIGDNLYMTGTPGLPSNQFFKYELGTGNGGGNWTSETNLPVALVGGDLVACGGKLYHIGGDLAAINGSGVNTVYEFDPATSQWTTKAPMPAALTGHGAVNWGDSIIFVAGGPWGATGSSRTVYYYRVATNTWGTINNCLPNGAGRRTFGIGISGNKILIAGGYAGVFLKTAYVGTINSASSITWVAAPNIPTSFDGLSRMGGEAAGGYFFTVGGERSGGGYHDTTYVYKFSTNTWAPVYAPKPTGVSNVFNCVAAKNYSNDTIRVFCPSGYAGSGITNLNFEVLKFKASVNVGIELIPKETTLNLWPNPARSLLNLEIGNTANPYVAEIFDIQGLTVKKFNIKTGVNTLDITGLAEGLYIVRVSTPKGLVTSKFNILR